MANDTNTLVSDIELALGGDVSQHIDRIIRMHIGSGKADLIEAGIVEAKVTESDPLIYTALFQYVMSLMDNIDRRQIAHDSYELQKDKLRHHVDYIIGG